MEPNAAEITKKSASNLALAFVSLPKEKRDAMTILYAFCREIDDIADEESIPVERRRAQLGDWRRELIDAGYGEADATIPLIAELIPVIRQYGLRREDFEALLDGVESDLEPARLPDWEALEQYCYRVASAVGLLSIPIFGYRDPVCRDYALALGKALQLTNILRDVAEDAENGRIYLPQTWMEEAKVTSAELFEGRYSPRYRELGTRVAAEARAFYSSAKSMLPEEDRSAMVAAELMGAVYWRLLLKLEQRGFNVFDGPRVRLPKWRKILLILQSLVGARGLGRPRSLYGD